MVALICMLHQFGTGIGEGSGVHCFLSEVLRAEGLEAPCGMQTELYLEALGFSVYPGSHDVVSPILLYSPKPQDTGGAAWRWIFDIALLKCSPV